MNEKEKKLLIDNMTENLPMLRKKLEITQEELANLIGVSRSTIMAIENKKSYYCIKTLRKIFRALEIEEEAIEKMDAYLRFLYIEYRNYNH